MTTWTTRPPQYRFDGSQLQQAIRAREDAEHDANPNHRHWADGTLYWAKKCERVMGAKELDAFMAAYDMRTLEAQYTARDLMFALMHLAHELKFTRDEAQLRRALGWPVAEVA